ncbi:MAG: cytochrome c [Paracoccaceae bacterium]|nr:cytochrome c [Paracoccaceae bacterium]
MKIKFTLAAIAAIGLTASPMMAGVGHDDDSAADEHEPIELQLTMPILDSERGRELFVSKGCVACHAVNGVGGEDASPLDAHNMDLSMNPFDFAAKMWMMAPYMIEAQMEAFDEQILFEGDELADIIAFLHDDSEQHELTEASLPPEIREMMDHAHGEEGGEVVHAEEIGH